MASVAELDDVEACVVVAGLRVVATSAAASTSSFSKHSWFFSITKKAIQARHFLWRCGWRL